MEVVPEGEQQPCLAGEPSGSGDPAVTTSPSVDSDEETRHLRKRKGETELDNEEGNVPVGEDRRITLSTEEFVDALLNQKKKEYSCQDAHCSRTFPSIEDYNAHYMSKHMHKCSVCKRQLPGAHLLELHVLEIHDTLFSLMAERKAMFACLAEECPEKFLTAAERYSHFHGNHKHHELFPAFRHFQNVSENSNGRQPKKGSKPSNKNRNKKSENATDMELVDDDKAVSSSVTSKSEGDGVMDVQTPTMEIKQPTKGDLKSNAKKVNTKTDIKFGRHATPFRPWHASSGEKAPKPGNSMDLSSFKDILDSTSELSESTGLKNGNTVDCSSVTTTKE
ncbi:unnamed protein product [Allacma fusca]|uniref:C2H2-type domain-containing protein n=1 Tax=Allacma fusca TaxID=39272 RepID=A0A8J2PE76_9HEXA|nr:unnamed protein product [Allacma fusca]